MIVGNSNSRVEVLMSRSSFVVKSVKTKASRHSFGQDTTRLCIPHSTQSHGVISCLGGFCIHAWLHELTAALTNCKNYFRYFVAQSAAPRITRQSKVQQTTSLTRAAKASGVDIQIMSVSLILHPWALNFDIDAGFLWAARLKWFLALDFSKLASVPAVISVST